VSVFASTWWRRGARIGGFLGVVLAVLAVRALVASHGELGRAHALAEEGEVDASIVHYRRAARWYVPASPHVPEALDALARIGAGAERDGDTERALFAWRSIRGAILSTRSFYLPHRGRLEEADARIAELMASEEPPPIDAGKAREALRAEHLRLLHDARHRPHVGWTLLLLVGFFAWVGGAFAFASRAFDEEDRLIGAQAWRWGGVIAAGLCLWIVGMALA
jgi:hypothetical protein